ncbi:alanine:cation symporter family protein, partial [Staphylococcus haemolyticus]
CPASVGYPAINPKPNNLDRRFRIYRETLSRFSCAASADLFMGLMAIVNLISIIGLSNITIAVMKDYQKQRKAGMKPVFKPENLEINLFGIETWGRENQLPKK